MLLAIDTSIGTSVAIVDGQRGVLAEHSCDDTRSHAELIGELIAACLADSAVPVSELAGVVAGMGPGPFTGLRVGIAAARAFAFGAGIRLIPLVSHDALAVAFYTDGGSGPLLVVSDARRKELYWCAYSGVDSGRGPVAVPIRAHGPSLSKAAELETTVPDFGSYRLQEPRAVSAASLGLLAETLLAAGRGFDGPSQALYLRSPDVTLSAGPKRVSS